MLLLSNYKPKDFGSSKMTLTIDGGQHMRSPGDHEEPKITQKHVESIFQDPTFDHRDQIFKNEKFVRDKLVGEVRETFDEIANKAHSPKNYNKFYWSKEMDRFGFGLPKESANFSPHRTMNYTKTTKFNNPMNSTFTSFGQS